MYLVCDFALNAGGEVPDDSWALLKLEYLLKLQLRLQRDALLAASHPKSDLLQPAQLHAIIWRTAVVLNHH